MKDLSFTPPTWATNANYPAGADPWAGLPLRVNPGAGNVSAGFRPKQKPPAQFLNYLFGKVGDDLTTVTQLAAHTALRTWSHGDQPDSTIQNLQVVGVRRAVSDEVPRIPVVFGYKASSSNRIYLAHTPDGQSFSSVADLSTAAFQRTAPFNIVAGGPGILFADSHYSTDYGATWAVINAAWFTGGNPIKGVHYANLTGLGVERYFLALEGAAVLRFSGTAGGVPFNGTCPSLASADVEFADNGLNTVVMVGREAASGGYFSAFRTTDAGTNWTKLFDMPGTTAASVTYSTNAGKFVIWNDLGQIIVSADSSSWAITGTTATTANGFRSGRGTLAACGPALVKAFTKTLGSIYEGIAYSFDLGFSWYPHFFTLDGSIAPIASFNGRLFVRGINNRVHVSGPLSLPTVAEF